jgi:hypothetical protein
MTISTTVLLGVSARLSLCYENIDIIKKLFNKKSIFIHGIKHSPIDYNEQTDCFDSGILDVLCGLNSNEEFNKKALEIAELRNDRYVTCLRRKIEYSNQDDYKNFIHDDDDCIQYSDEESYSNDLEFQNNKDNVINIDDLFSEDDEDNSDHETKNNHNCNFDKTDKIINESIKQSKYKDFNCNKLIFDIFYPFSNFDANYDNNDTSYKTSYDTVSTSTKNYLNNLHEAIHFFKENGITEEKLVICNYNTCELR